mmetsp:Transcript_57657/g.182608  ORF Transcript_57657/g.182608 Transcript_57657/m.182608 type:complete len:205 (+) Transcript_57657:311-925(+)
MACAPPWMLAGAPTSYSELGSSNVRCSPTCCHPSVTPTSSVTTQWMGTLPARPTGRRSRAMCGSWRRRCRRRWRRGTKARETRVGGPTAWAFSYGKRETNTKGTSRLAAGTAEGLCTMQTGTGSRGTTWMAIDTARGRTTLETGAGLRASTRPAKGTGEARCSMRTGACTRASTATASDTARAPIPISSRGILGHPHLYQVGIF